MTKHHVIDLSIPATIEECDKRIIAAGRIKKLVSKATKPAIQDQIDALLDRRLELSGQPVMTDQGGLA